MATNKQGKKPKKKPVRIKKSQLKGFSANRLSSILKRKTFQGVKLTPINKRLIRAAFQRQKKKEKGKLRFEKPQRPKKKNPKLP